MDKNNIIAGAIAAVVGLGGGFFGRKASKESNSTNQLVAAAEAWSSYGHEMKIHWETCEQKYDKLEQEMAETKKEMAVQAKALEKAVDEIEALRKLVKEIKS